MLFAAPTYLLAFEERLRYMVSPLQCLAAVTYLRKSLSNPLSGGIRQSPVLWAGIKRPFTLQGLKTKGGKAMTNSKINVDEILINTYVQFIAEHIPGMLEVIGGGPAGPGGVSIIEKATPAQREKLLAGVKRIAASAAKIQRQL
jgi:hypothetical protein